MYVVIGGAASSSQAPESLYVSSFNETDGLLRVLHAMKGLPKTAYLAADSTNRIVYAVGTNEAQEGTAVSYALDPSTAELLPITAQLCSL